MPQICMFEKNNSVKTHSVCWWDFKNTQEMCGRMTFFGQWMHPFLLGKNESLKILTLLVDEIKGSRLQGFTGSTKNMNSQIQTPEWNYEINMLTTSVGWIALQYWLKLLTDYVFTLCNHQPLPNEVALHSSFFFLLPGNIAQNIASSVFTHSTVKIHKYSESLY